MNKNWFTTILVFGLPLIAGVFAYSLLMPIKKSVSPYKSGKELAKVYCATWEGVWGFWKTNMTPLKI